MIRIAIPINIFIRLHLAMYVCICNAVTEREIRQAVGLGATTLHELREVLGVAGDCGKCGPCVRSILREELDGASPGDMALARSA